MKRVTTPVFQTGCASKDRPQRLLAPLDRLGPDASVFAAGRRESAFYVAFQALPSSVLLSQHLAHPPRRARPPCSGAALARHAIAYLSSLVAPRLENGPKNCLRQFPGTPTVFDHRFAVARATAPLRNRVAAFHSAGGALPPPETGRWGALIRLGPDFPGGSPNPPPKGLRGLRLDACAPPTAALNGQPRGSL